jgi:hypothetical protein
VRAGVRTHKRRVRAILRRYLGKVTGLGERNAADQPLPRPWAGNRTAVPAESVREALHPCRHRTPAEEAQEILSGPATPKILYRPSLTPRATGATSVWRPSRWRTSTSGGSGYDKITSQQMPMALELAGELRRAHETKTKRAVALKTLHSGVQ